MAFRIDGDRKIKIKFIDLSIYLVKAMHINAENE